MSMGRKMALGPAEVRFATFISLNAEEFYETLPSYCVGSNIFVILI